MQVYEGTRSERAALAAADRSRRAAAARRLYEEKLRQLYADTDEQVGPPVGCPMLVEVELVALELPARSYEPAGLDDQERPVQADAKPTRTRENTRDPGARPCAKLPHDVQRRAIRAAQMRRRLDVRRRTFCVFFATNPRSLRPRPRPTPELVSRCSRPRARGSPHPFDARLLSTHGQGLARPVRALRTRHDLASPLLTRSRPRLPPV